MHITNLTPSYSITISNVLSLSKVSNTFLSRYATNLSCGTQSVFVNQWTCSPLGVVACTTYQPSKLFFAHRETFSYFFSWIFSKHSLNFISFSPFLATFYHKEYLFSIYCYINFGKRKRGAVPLTSLSFRPDLPQIELQHRRLQCRHSSM